MTMHGTPVLDIGGTHVTAALVDDGRIRTAATRPLDADASADAIIEVVVATANELSAPDGDAWGVAIPGPFDSVSGRGSFAGVDKFGALAGIDLGVRLADGLGTASSGIVFVNDADAWALGEWSAHGRPHRLCCVTLGTGVGTGFVEAGRIVTDDPRVPTGGDLHHQRWNGDPIEDHVSRRALIRAFGTPGLDVADIAARALAGDGRAAAVFARAMGILAEVLVPWLDSFRPDALVVGGAIATSWDLIGPPLDEALGRAVGRSLDVRPSVLGRDAPLIGAAELLRATAWMDTDRHQNWLRAEERSLLAFHDRPERIAQVGYAPLTTTGATLGRADRELYATARLVHCFALESMLGRPGAGRLACHGVDALLGPFLDREDGGWFAAVSPEGRPVDTAKGAYGHAFVLLAAASAVQADLPYTGELFALADATLDTRFWDEAEGAAHEAYTRDWIELEPHYRGQNANMHLAEASLAAYEASGDEKHLRRAERLAELIPLRHGPTSEWRIPEHFTAAWEPDLDYNIDRPADPFRPSGSLVGHWFEWARLLLQLAAIPGSRAPNALETAIALFDAGVADGWIPGTGGFLYSVDGTGRPVNTDQMHWVLAEAIGAAVHLYRTTAEARYESWCRRFWRHAERHLIDRVGGSWWHQLDASGAPAFTTWSGKPDLYHALQATLYARLDHRVGLATAAARHPMQ